MLNTEKKTKRLIIIIFSIIILKIFIEIAYENDFLSKDHLYYKFATASMKEITTSQFNDLLINNQNDSSITLIYMGRESCPVCIELLPQIKQYFKETQLLNNGEKVTQYYFDSEKNKSEETKELRESIGADYVPSIIVINKEVFVFDSDDIISDNFFNVLNASLN